MAERGTLEDGGMHPATRDAFNWIRQQSPETLSQMVEAFASCAIEGNELGEVCGETLRRLLNSEPVSDRYLLGLCWSMKSMLDQAQARRDENRLLGGAQDTVLFGIVLNNQSEIDYAWPVRHEGIIARRADEILKTLDELKNKVVAVRGDPAYWGGMREVDGPDEPEGWANRP